MRATLTPLDPLPTVSLSGPRPAADVAAVLDDYGLVVLDPHQIIAVVNDGGIASVQTAGKHGLADGDLVRLLDVPGYGDEVVGSSSGPRQFFLYGREFSGSYLIGPGLTGRWEPRESE